MYTPAAMTINAKTSNLYFTVGSFLVLHSPFLPSLQSLQDIEKFLILRLVVNVMDVNVADDALFVHDEEGPFAVAFFAQDAVTLGHLTVRPKVGQQGHVLYPQ